jgi:DNA-binding transcriptional regulator YdaS (Cro superfamily)
MRAQYDKQKLMYSAASETATGGYMHMQLTPSDALRRAIEAAGGQTKLSALLGCSQQRVWNWTVAGRAPVKMCPKIEAATGVPCEELRPDINWGYMRQKLQGGSQ